jgi:hypothetical protein
MKREERKAIKQAWKVQRRAEYLKENKAAREAEERKRREEEIREHNRAQHARREAMLERWRIEGMERQRLEDERQRLQDEREELLANMHGLSVPDYRRIQSARFELLRLLRRRARELERQEGSHYRPRGVARPNLGMIMLLAGLMGGSR